MTWRVLGSVITTTSSSAPSTLRLRARSLSPSIVTGRLPGTSPRITRTPSPSPNSNEEEGAPAPSSTPLRGPVSNTGLLRPKINPHLHCRLRVKPGLHSPGQSGRFGNERRSLCYPLAPASASVAARVHDAIADARRVVDEATGERVLAPLHARAELEQVRRRTAPDVLPRLLPPPCAF